MFWRWGFGGGRCSAADQAPVLTCDAMRAHWRVNMGGTRIPFGTIVALVCSLSVVGHVTAQSYPNRPIKMIVPLPPGATADTLPRIIGEKLTAKWGQPVIIENRPGAAQN